MKKNKQKDRKPSTSQKRQPETLNQLKDKNKRNTPKKQRNNKRATTSVSKIAGDRNNTNNSNNRDRKPLTNKKGPTRHPKEKQK